MKGQRVTWLVATIRTRLVLVVIVGLLLANFSLLAGRALADLGDIGGGVGFHQHLACRLVSTGPIPAPVGERYGTVRVLDLHAQETPGTTAKTSCDPAEQYIQIVINHETGAHP